MPAEGAAYDREAGRGRADCHGGQVARPKAAANPDSEPATAAVAAVGAVARLIEAVETAQTGGGPADRCLDALRQR